MKTLLKRFSVAGLGIERLLEALRAQGITLYQISRPETRRVEAAVSLPDFVRLESCAEQLGFTVKPLPDTGSLRRLNLLWKQRLLLGLALVFLGGLFFALQCVWTIEITDAGVYRGEVESCLRERGIHPGILRSQVDVQALCDALSYRLPRVAWVRADMRGSTLRIALTQGVPLPAHLRDSRAGDWVADCDGIIEEVQVFRGTPQVRAGDAVRAGDILIEGQESIGPGGEAVPVQASGKITARIWRTGQAAADRMETVSVPTGRECQAKALRTPWYSFILTKEADYLTCDRETSRVPIGGAWFPLWLEKTRCVEVALEKKERDLGPLQEEAGRLALRNLLSSCGKTDEIIDKAQKFSMIEGEKLLAEATAEIRTEIGRFQPYHTD